jgi:hypothetical protein
MGMQTSKLQPVTTQVNQQNLTPADFFKIILQNSFKDANFWDFGEPITGDVTKFKDDKKLKPTEEIKYNVQKFSLDFKKNQTLFDSPISIRACTEFQCSFQINVW